MIIQNEKFDGAFLYITKRKMSVELHLYINSKTSSRVVNHSLMIKKCNVGYNMILIPKVHATYLRGPCNVSMGLNNKKILAKQLSLKIA